MKLAILKPIRMTGAPSVEILPGSMVELPDQIARDWIMTGRAKPVPQTVEKAVLPPAETAILRQAETPPALAGAKNKTRKH